VFGYVMANIPELPKDLQKRYMAVYCGICRQIRDRAGQIARLGLSYDMAFLALLLMSLYEPEEAAGSRACSLHPFKPRPWVDNDFIRYAADMNVALAYYNCMDDYSDDGKLTSKAMASVLEKNQFQIKEQWPRQCQAIETCIAELSRLEREGCKTPTSPQAALASLWVSFWFTGKICGQIPCGKWVWLWAGTST